MHGPSPFGFHLTNVLWHAANAVLRSKFWSRVLLRAIGPSLATAVLFALHPLHVESVAWVTEPKGRSQHVLWPAGPGGLFPPPAKSLGSPLPGPDRALRFEPARQADAGHVALSPARAGLVAAATVGPAGPSRRSPRSRRQVHDVGSTSSRKSCRSWLSASGPA